MTRYELTQAQAARKAAILAEIEMTTEAVQDGEVSLDDLRGLLKNEDDATKIAAYTTVIAIMTEA